MTMVTQGQTEVLGVLGVVETLIWRRHFLLELFSIHGYNSVSYSGPVLDKSSNSSVAF